MRLLGRQQPIEQGLANHPLALHAQGLQITQVAGQQAPFPVAHIQGVGRAIDHHPHELELVAQGALGLVPCANQLAQGADPQHRHQQQYTGNGKALQDDPAIRLPVAVGHDNLAAPTVGQFVHFLRDNAQQGLVQNR
ncbi:hypothetical protein D3C80_964570 [compost metagenome]